MNDCGIYLILIYSHNTENKTPMSSNLRMIRDERGREERDEPRNDMGRVLKI